MGQFEGWEHSNLSSGKIQSSEKIRKLLLRGVVHGTPCRSLDYQTVLIRGVLQTSVLRLLLFNIYLNYLFFFLQAIGICNFADDTSTFVRDETLESVLDKLEGNL